MCDVHSDQLAMSSHELAQHSSKAARRSVDGFLIGFIVAVMALMALGGAGLL